MEWLAAAGAGGAVVVMSVMLTLLMADQQSLEVGPQPEPRDIATGYHAPLQLADAYEPCRQRAQQFIPQAHRNLRIDQRSSHYDPGYDLYVVYLNVELLSRTSAGKRLVEDAHVVCRVSAKTAKVTSIRMVDLG